MIVVIDLITVEFPSYRVRKKSALTKKELFDVNEIWHRFKVFF